MTEEIAPKKEEIVLEVGPGEGILAGILAQKGAKVITIEKDSRLIPVLKGKNFEVIEEDILKFDPKKYKLKEGEYKIVGNIPYYITSHLLRIVLEEWPKPKLILFMVQKEVAERITANPPKMNLLALAVQFYAEAKMVKRVSRNNFRPVPKVDSALIKITPKPSTTWKPGFQKNFFKTAHACFQNKRKQILSSLSNNLRLPKTTTEKALSEAGIDSNRRPETLNVEEWVKLTKLLFPEPPSA